MVDRGKANAQRKGGGGWVEVQGAVAKTGDMRIQLTYVPSSLSLENVDCTCASQRIKEK